MKLKEIPCPVCGACRYRFVNRCNLTAQDSPLGLDSVVLVRCFACGLLYVNPQPQADTQEMQKLYGQSYFNAGYMRFYGMEEGEEAAQSNESFEQRLSFIERYAKKGRLLDIGCASGAFMKFAESGGWDVYGIEASAYVAEIAARNYGTRVVKGSLEDSRFPEDFFDVICIGDVLEHIASPVEFLTGVKKVLKNAGIVYIATPNSLSLYYKVFMLLSRFTHKNYFVLPYHLIHYSPSALLCLLEKTGYKVKYLRFSNSTTLEKFFKRAFMVTLNILASLIGQKDRILLIAGKA